MFAGFAFMLLHTAAVTKDLREGQGSGGGNCPTLPQRKTTPAFVTLTFCIIFSFGVALQGRGVDS